MAQQFKFIDTAGKEQMVTASSGEEAMRIAPNIGSSSGVMRVDPQQSFDRAQNPKQPVNPVDVSSSMSTQLPEGSNIVSSATTNLSMGINGIPPSQLTSKSSEADVMASMGRTTPSEEKQLGIIGNIESSLKKMLGKSERGAELYEETGMERKQIQLNELDKQLAQEQRALENEIRSMSKNAQADSRGGLSSAINDVRGQSLQRQADLSIIKSGVQGDISTAQNIIQQKLDLEFGPVQEEIEYYSSLLQLSQAESGILDKKEQDQLNFILGERQSAMNDAKAEKQALYDFAFMMAQNGDTAGAQAAFSGQMTMEAAAMRAGQSKFQAGQTPAGGPGFDWTSMIGEGEDIMSFDDFANSDEAQRIIDEEQNKALMSFTPEKRQEVLREIYDAQYNKEVSSIAREVNFTPQQVASLSRLNLDPVQIQQVMGISNGNLSPIPEGAVRSEFNQGILAGLDAVGFDVARAQLEYNSMKRRLNTMNTKDFLKYESAITNLDFSIGQAEGLYRQWQSTGLPTGFKSYNKAALIVASNMPGESGAIAQTLLSHIEDMANELAVVYKGGGTPTDKSLESAQKSLQGDWPAESFNMNLGLMRENLDNRLRTLSSLNFIPDNRYSETAPTSSNMSYQDYLNSVKN